MRLRSALRPGSSRVRPLLVAIVAAGVFLVSGCSSSPTELGNLVDNLDSATTAADAALQTVPPGNCVAPDELAVPFPKAVVSSGEVCANTESAGIGRALTVKIEGSDISLVYSPSSAKFGTGCEAQVNGQWHAATGNNGDPMNPCPDGFEFYGY